MEASSQTANAKRLWTEEEQQKAEEMRAKGSSWRAIGRALQRHHEVVQFHLDAEAAENQRKLTRQWRRDNSDRHRENARLRYKLNVDKERERHRKRRKVNPEKAREKNRLWRKANLDKVRESNRRRFARISVARRNTAAPTTSQHRIERFALFGDCCAYCGSADDLTVDHVLPFAAGGLDERSNVVPACRTCNSSKYVYTVDQWYLRQPFFTDERWAKIQRHCPSAASGKALQACYTL